MILKLKRTPGIFLVGFMGSGKTTVGRLLAGRLGWNFVDIDDTIEAAQGMPIGEIFATRGEAAFRQMEAEALREVAATIARGKPAVVASGGGAFAQAANAEVIGRHGVSIWLDVPIEVAWQRVSRESHRPLARSYAEFSRLFEARREAYGRADYRVPAGGEPSEVVDAILSLGLFE
jgi:shikimate kinase